MNKKKQFQCLMLQYPKAEDELIAMLHEEEMKEIKKKQKKGSQIWQDNNK